MTRNPARARRLRYWFPFTFERLENRDAPALFGPIESLPVVGDAPHSAAVGDFTGDAIPDLVVANYLSNNVTILIGDGTGHFVDSAASPISVGTNPNSVVVGDFNGDAKLDLVVANYGSNDVTVLLGNGSGGFTLAAGTPVSVGANPFSVVVGDFNGDVKQDLAVANFNGNSITLLLGDGTGIFTQSATSPIAVGSTPASLVVGDFNGDAKTDLAVANMGSGNVTILLGSGAGAFTKAAGSPVAVGVFPRAVIVGDLNGDHKQDLAVANAGSDNLSILLGDGTGKFTVGGSPTSVGVAPFALASGDFNGDGNLDLGVANHDAGNLTVLIGSGAGEFAPAAGSPVVTGLLPSTVVVGDFNQDGKADFVIANEGDDNAAILLNQASSTTTVVDSSAPNVVFGQAITLTATVTAASGDTPTGTVTVRNGATVLASAPLVGGVATVVFGSLAAGNYTTTAAFSSDAFYASTSAPLAQVVSKAGTTVTISNDPLSASNGHFVTLSANVVTLLITKPTGSVTFFDDKTKLGTVALNANAGASLLADLQYHDRKIRAEYSGDSNFLGNEAQLDLNVSASKKKYVTGTDISGGPHVRVFNLDGSLDREFFAFSATFKGGVRVAAGDVNGDGFDDIITGAGPGGGPHVRVFDGKLESVTEIRSFFAYSPSFSAGVFVAASDVDADGKADIIVGPGRGLPKVRVFSGVTGAELFSVLAYSPGMSLGVRVAAGDVSGDGKADIIVGAGPGFAQKVRVFDATGKHQELFSFAAPYGITFRGGVSVAAGDVDGDGVADVLVTPGQNHTADVLVFSGKTKTQIASIKAFGAFLGGASVGAKDINGDGKADIITGAKLGGGPHVRIFSADGTVLRSFFAYDPTFLGGIWVG